MIARWLAAAALGLIGAACAENSVGFPPADAGAGRDGSIGGADAAVSLQDAAVPAFDAGGGGDAAGFVDAGLRSDASAVMDGGMLPSAPCMRDIRDDVTVPDPGGESRFEGVRALGVDAVGRMYVLSRSAAPYTAWITVLEPSPSYALVGSFGADVLTAAQDMAVGPDGDVVVAEWDPDGTEPPRVHTFDAQGVHAGVWIASGPGGAEAWGLARDDAGRVYVGGLMVYRYDAMGTYLDGIGRFGSAPGQIGLARGLAIDPRGSLWVADLVHSTIHQYDLVTKAHLVEIGGRGEGPGLFDADAPSDLHFGPSRIALDGQGAIYANDPYASRIQKLSRQGAFLGEFSFGGGVDVGPLQIGARDGLVYVGRDSAIAVVCPL